VHSLAWRESLTGQQTSHAVQHCMATQPTKKQTRLFPQAQQWKNGSGSRLRDRDLTHRLDLGQWMHTDSPDTTRAFSIQTEVKPALSESITGFWFSTEVYTGFSVQKVYEVFLQSSRQSYCSEPIHPQAVCSHERVSPFTVHPNCFIRMHQGRHLSPWRLHAFHQHASPSLGQELRIKKYKWHMFFWNNNKILFLGLSPSSP
jgi:hypothetical protein